MTAPYHRGGKPSWVDDRPKVPISLMVNAFAKQEDELDYIFRTVLAEAIPGYQDRPQQRDMAQVVYRCMEQSRHGVIEAGTGTGKSFALLIAAFLRAVKHEKRIVVATGTLVLQQQYQRDLEFLDKVLGPYFEQRHGRAQTWAVSKGRSNFFCFEGEEAPQCSELDQINEWLETTETGDLAELPFDLTQDRYRALRQAITATAEDCPGKMKCPSGDSCFYYAARRKAEDADVIIVNHMILALDLLLDGQLLPEHDAVLIDEAHKLPKWVRDATEAKLSRSRLTYLRRKADKLNLSTDRLQQAGEIFFDQAERLVVERLPREDSDDEPSCRLQGEDFAGGSLDALVRELERLEDVLAGKTDKPRAESLAKSLKQFRLDLSSLIRPNPGKVLWAKQERDKHGGLMAPAMRLTMVRVAPFLRETLLKRTCVFASATLAAGPHDFSFFKTELGIEAAHEMQVASPFDYRRNLQFYVPKLPADLLDRKRFNGRLETRSEQNRRIADAYEPVYRQMLTLTGGNALLLFTSNAMLNEMFRRLSRAVPDGSGRLRQPWPMKKQGDAPKGALRDWLAGKELDVVPAGRVLLGLESFWEGIDVPGPSLVLVMVDKFPFTPPSDVVANAIKESYGIDELGPDVAPDRIGRAGFNAYTLPTALILVKQACGRINRCDLDRGVFCFMDSRIWHKQYGKAAFACLPGAPVLGRDNLSPESLGVIPQYLKNRRKPA
ncbi:MAG: ATP-dependent DNA helicase DinG [Candidatus Xenobia bacterium]